MNSRIFVEELLTKAGIKLNGDRPFDVKITDERLYDRAMSSGSLGIGEAYMDGWWDSPRLDEFFYKVFSSDIRDQLATLGLLFHVIKGKIFNFQSKTRAFEVGEKHYDIGNNLYTHMLGESMVYTCAYWKDAKDLDSAQYAKLDLVCKKMGLKPGMKVLDIGCGWGGFMKFAAEKYGVSCVGISVSKEQTALGRKICHGLPIEFKIMDYRDMTGEFDRVVSIGMLEAVGYKNFDEFMKVAKNCLKENGLFLLHTIGNNKATTLIDPWVNKYIFPNGLIPSMSQIIKASEKFFVLEDVHNFGVYYDKTLMAWYENFNKNWDKIKKDYDERFYRMWKYYLLQSVGLFRSRKLQLWQIVLSPKGVVDGYESVR